MASELFYARKDNLLLINLLHVYVGDFVKARFTKERSGSGRLWTATFDVWGSVASKLYSGSTLSFALRAKGKYRFAVDPVATCEVLCCIWAESSPRSDKTLLLHHPSEFLRRNG